MKNDLDKKLKQFLGSTRELDIHKFSSKVMEKLKEEKKKEKRYGLVWRIFSLIQAYFLTKREQLLRLSYVSAFAIIILILSLFFLKKGQLESPLYVASNGKNSTESISTPKNIDNILLSTDTDTILLTGEYHLISDDPLLRPHSIWDQQSLNITLSL